MKGVYRLADRNIEICSLHSYVHTQCAEYATDDVPDFSVTVTEERIDFERERSRKKDLAEGFSDREYPEDYLESLAVYRLIAEGMPSYDTILLHGSAVAVGGRGYIFTARSGTGKSTHVRLWREMLGSDAVVINDDKPLIRVAEDGITVYGTPWDGKHHLNTNTCVKLEAVCILERSEENHIRRVSMNEALPMLVKQTYRPLNPEALARTLILIDRLGKNVKLYRLGCNMDISAAKLSYNTMKEG